MITGVSISTADGSVLNTIISDAVKSSDACTVVEYGLSPGESTAIHDADRATISISDLSLQMVQPSMVLDVQ